MREHMLPVERDDPAAHRLADAEQIHYLFSDRAEAKFQDALNGRLSGAVRQHGRQIAVHSGAPSQELAALFGDPVIPEVGIDFGSYARFLGDVVVPHSVNMSSPRCLGHMTNVPPRFMHVLADIVGRLNQNLVKTEASRALAVIERQTLGMLHRLAYGCNAEFYREHVQSHASTLGLMTSGGTLANLTALWCARNASFPRDAGFRGVEQEGLDRSLRHYGHQRAVVVGSGLLHYSIQKAAAILGLGAEGVVEVPVDPRQRIDLGALEHVIEDCKRHRVRIVALIGVAGTTDCGSIDPLEEMASIARREQVHFHVDAVWGAPLLFSSTHQSKIAGLASADSLAIDGHKQLGLPIGAGVVLFRDPQAAQVIEKNAPYMLHVNSGDLGRVSLEGSRPGAALLLHAAMHLLGQRGYGALIDQHLANAARFASLISETEDFELLHAPQTNIVLYRFVPAALRTAVASGTVTDDDQRSLNALNEALQQAQYEAGASFVSRTTMRALERYRGTAVVALRAVVGHPLVTLDDMRAVLADQRRIGARLPARQCQTARFQKVDP